jgi:hypothetical protein
MIHLVNFFAVKLSLKDMEEEEEAAASKKVFAKPEMDDGVRIQSVAVKTGKPAPRVRAWSQSYDF